MGKIEKINNCILCGSKVHPYRLMNTDLYGMMCHNDKCKLHSFEPTYKTREALMKDWNKGVYEGVNKE